MVKPESIITQGEAKCVVGAVPNVQYIQEREGG
jgi:hypothetical protein